ncbi:YabP/YqfC family sporulation protein [Desulfotruncus alcoholivorax]|uniref:YabP/YqfC family sporulation protein n=1 Tax=Desulfotruncus alcoholivorax TaxID=265477 RepID=UPI0004010D8A|nr:YabP/YqfC family sporulation protein [Desulfotruncus alcoholivorax]
MKGYPYSGREVILVVEQKQGFSNRLTLTERNHLVVQGVEYVGKFNEREINLDTNLGFLVLRGEGLHITNLDLETKNMVIEGRISALEFYDRKSGKSIKGKGMLDRIFK